MKSAIIYCSNKGTTEKLAKKIGRDFSADMFKVEPAEDYGSFFAAVARVAREKRAKMSAAVKTEVPDLSAYDTVFVGYPIWYGTVPAFMKEFLSRCDLAGKTVIPFATASASHIRGSIADLEAACKGAEIRYPYSFAVMRRDSYPEWKAQVEGMKR